MTEESLLTDDVRALIGAASEAAPVQVTAVAVRRAGDVYYGRPGAVPPAGEPVPGIAIAGLETGSTRLNIPDLMPNSVLISNEWEFERPLRMGEELMARSRLADISERFGGKFGYSIYIRTDVEFSDSEGALVARASSTLMQYDPRNAREGGGE
ncbi:MAG: MaoC family dehydratase N-terminal domain-containing protein [Dehalococcoidia bacterium]|nr:MaoC family dehydratase N-terminal domain-containing protein [Dehalococcoidia bacterium]MCA9844772.1 MaoC family dehydratase N-terminal domain-containing protein [Dehalococcoidia bacterium]MCA9853582.1 MaoC family dehydratase N-terminal domain-containing protein [Dehalococcoidia bacterium]